MLVCWEMVCVRIGVEKRVRRKRRAGRGGRRGEVKEGEVEKCNEAVMNTEHSQAQFL